MRRLALALVTLALGGAALASCRDAAGPAAGPALDGSAAAQLDRAVAAGKVAICHAAGRADDPHFVALTVSESAASAHLDPHGTPAAGHEQDYLVTDRTPCPPPATPGQLRICKVGSPGIPAGTAFGFVVDGVTVTVPSGGCVSRPYRVGTRVSVAESVPANTQLVGLTLAPAAAGTADPATGRASVVVGTDVATLTYTNRSTAAGDLVICKVAGVSVAPGTPFTFAVAGVPGTVTVAAGAAPAGTCGAPITVLAGPTLVTEPAATRPAGIIVAALAASPAASLLSRTPDGATLQITAGQTTTVTFTDGSATLGALVICKVAGPGIAIGTPATFVIPGGGSDLVVAAGAGPTGTCSAPRNIPAGTRDITEQLPPLATSAVASVVVSPATGDVGPAVNGRRVLVAAGITTTVTVTNVSTLGTLVICKVAGLGVAPGTPASFSVPAGGSDIVVTAGAAPTGNCSPPRLIPAGSRAITELVALGSGVGVGSVAVSPAANDLGAVPNGRQVNVPANATTTVTFTNVSTNGTLVLCKVAGAGIAVGSPATFTVPGGGSDITVTAGAGPTGNCSAPRSIPAGTRTITELGIFIGGTTVVGGVAVSPAAGDLGAAPNGRVVNVAAGITTTVTFTNVSNLGTLIICKVAGPNVALGTPATFNVPGGGADIVVPAGPAPTGNCSAPRLIPAGTRNITESAPLLFVTSVVVSPAANDLGAVPGGRTVLVPANATTTVTFTNSGPPPNP